LLVVFFVDVVLMVGLGLAVLGSKVPGFHGSKVPPEQLPPEVEA
jgi:hypothetical protein